MSKILDIWAIQGNAEELPVALACIKANDTIVFENAVINLTIGGNLIKDKIFGCAIFSEESDVLVLILQNAKVSAEDAKRILDENGIDYHLVSFQRPWRVKQKKESPEIWFAKDSYVVVDACNDTLNKGVKNLTYKIDRDIVSILEFQYEDNNKKLNTFTSKIVFTGAITLDDKIILLEGVDEKVIKKHQKDSTYILKHKGFTEEKTNNHSV